MQKQVCFLPENTFCSIDSHFDCITESAIKSEKRAIGTCTGALPKTKLILNNARRERSEHKIEKDNELFCMHYLFGEDSGFGPDFYKINSRRVIFQVQFNAVAPGMKFIFSDRLFCPANRII